MRAFLHWRRALLIALVLSVSTAAHALPLVIPHFEVDPTGPGFSIEAIDPGSWPRQHLCENLAGPAQLAYGQTSVGGETQYGDPHFPPGVPRTMSMFWVPEDGLQPARAGWELAFLEDPDLRNGWMSLSVMPPGGIIIDPQSGAQVFVGVQSISVVAVDNAGIIAGGWGFNTDQVGLAGFPANDPTAAGGISLLNNAMHNVKINIGLGPAPGSAVVTPMWPAGPSVIGPNFIIPGNNNFANIGWLQYYENGALRGQMAIPGTGVQGGMINWWDHVAVFAVPEPASLLLLGGGLVGIAARRRRRR